MTYCPPAAAHGAASRQIAAALAAATIEFHARMARMVLQGKAIALPNGCYRAI